MERHLHSSLADTCLVAISETCNLVVNCGSLACREDLVVGRCQASVANIVDDGVVKQNRRLRHNANRLT